MMRPSTRLAALALVVGLLVVSAPVAAAEAELDAHGWWWRVQGGAAELPPPPWVPEDGLAVANDVEGPSAIAGVRYELDDDVTMATLTLEVANEQGGEIAALRACPAMSRWRSAQAGTWDHRPSADCDAGEVSGVRDEEGETWTFDVSLLVADGLLNVLLLPGGELDAPDDEAAPVPGLPGAPGGDGGAAFQIAFEPPDQDSLQVSGMGGDEFEADDFEVEDTTDDGSAESTAGEQPEESPPAQTGEAAPFQPTPSGPSSPVGESRSSPPPDVAQPEESEEQPREEIALVAPPGDDARAQAPVAAEPAGFGDDLGRQAAALIALLAGVAAVVLSRAPSTGEAGIRGLRRSLVVRPEVAERAAAGATAAATTRGLGRFARPREGDPPPL